MLKEKAKSPHVIPFEGHFGSRDIQTLFSCVFVAELTWQSLWEGMESISSLALHHCLRYTCTARKTQGMKEVCRPSSLLGQGAGSVTPVLQRAGAAASWGAGLPPPPFCFLSKRPPSS